MTALLYRFGAPFGAGFDVNSRRVRAKRSRIKDFVLRSMLLANVLLATVKRIRENRNRSCRYQLPVHPNCTRGRASTSLASKHVQYSRCFR